jgi:hypothetical protein
MRLRNEDILIGTIKAFAIYSFLFTLLFAATNWWLAWHH